MNKNKDESEIKKISRDELLKRLGVLAGRNREALAVFVATLARLKIRPRCAAFYN